MRNAPLRKLFGQFLPRVASLSTQPRGQSAMDTRVVNVRKELEAIAQHPFFRVVLSVKSGKTRASGMRSGSLTVDFEGGIGTYVMRWGSHEPDTRLLKVEPPVGSVVQMPMHVFMDLTSREYERIEIRLEYDGTVRYDLESKQDLFEFEGNLTETVRNNPTKKKGTRRSSAKRDLVGWFWPR